MTTESHLLQPIGVVRSSLRNRREAPRQGSEGAPDAVLELEPAFAPALRRVTVGQELIVLTWLHLADRSVLETHPRDDPDTPLTGVFATRSSDRPNPIGLHRVAVTAVEAPTRLRVASLEAIDGTPIVDLKIALADRRPAAGPGDDRADMQTAPAPPRSRAERRRDTLAKLAREVDLWVASADASGGAYLVPLSFPWDATALTIATPRASRTARDLLRAGRARVARGPTRDVVIVEGVVEELPRGADVPLEDAHAGATGFDPRTLAEEYVYLRIAPLEIQAWREADELPGRRLMRGGEWLA